MLRSLILSAVSATMAVSVVHAEVLKVYGPVRTLPLIKEAAEIYAKAHGIQIDVVGGPTPKWIEQARQDVDLIFSGSETMMTDFVKAMESRIDSADAAPLYLRPSANLVRPGNLKGIRGLRDLLAPGRNVRVVNGAGQNGLWEDMTGRLGTIGAVKALRANIKGFAANSAEARKSWIDDPGLDAWIIWNIWQVSNPALAETVAVEPEYQIYRDSGIVLTTNGKIKPDAKAFVVFLRSAEGAAVFAKWGWQVGPVR